MAAVIEIAPDIRLARLTRQNRVNGRYHSAGRINGAPQCLRKVGRKHKREWAFCDAIARNRHVREQDAAGSIVNGAPVSGAPDCRVTFAFSASVEFQMISSPRL
jgi:hypothetical protein